MVSLWPWKADETASFEKTLSGLSDKIKKASITRDGLRARSRRYKALWTLYTSLTYVVGALILVLVTGWQNWGAMEYGVIIGSPLVIYLVRAALSAYYNYRVSNNQTYLDDLNQQRESAIEKFKSATKYNSTQQLLEKYGAAPATSSSSSRTSPSSATKRQTGKSDLQQQRQARTNMAPPPTANIRRPEAMSAPSQIPQNAQSNTPTSARIQSLIPAAFPISQGPDTTADFAPNAFSAPPQYSTSNQGTPHQQRWYDRMLDVLLGEDEGRAINRIALICTHCRLVNGQAPPGMKRLEDVGKWRCSGCGGWNGEQSEARRIIEAVGATGGDISLEGSVTESRRGKASEGVRKRKPEMAQKDKVDGASDGNIEEEPQEFAAGDSPSSVWEEEEAVSTPESKLRAGTGSPNEDESSDAAEAGTHISPARSTRSRTKSSRKTR